MSLGYDPRVRNAEDGGQVRVGIEMRRKVGYDPLIKIGEGLDWRLVRVVYDP